MISRSERARRSANWTKIQCGLADPLQLPAMSLTPVRMTIRGTRLFLHLPTQLSDALREHLGAAPSADFLTAVQEDLLDLAATWRRVGRERDVVVFLDEADDAALHRVARRGLTPVRGVTSRELMRQRARKALGDCRVVVVLDQPAPDYSLSAIDSLFRRALEGIATVADLSGDWLGLGVCEGHKAVLDEGTSLSALVERARLRAIPVHPLAPSGRLDDARDLEALRFRILERRARAPRSRRVLLALDAAER